MFQEEMNKIREAENEADRRLVECEATVRKMYEEAEARRLASLEDAKKAAARVREAQKAEAEEKADTLKKAAEKQALIDSKAIRFEAEKRLEEAVLLIVEGVKQHGSR